MATSEYVIALEFQAIGDCDILLVRADNTSKDNPNVKYHTFELWFVTNVVTATEPDANGVWAFQRPFGWFPGIAGSGLGPDAVLCPANGQKNGLEDLLKNLELMPSGLDLLPVKLLPNWLDSTSAAEKIWPFFSGAPGVDSFFAGHYLELAGFDLDPMLVLAKAAIADLPKAFLPEGVASPNGDVQLPMLAIRCENCNPFGDTLPVAGLPGMQPPPSNAFSSFKQQGWWGISFISGPFTSQSRGAFTMNLVQAPPKSVSVCFPGFASIDPPTPTAFDAPCVNLGASGSKYSLLDVSEKYSNSVWDSNLFPAPLFKVPHTKTGWEACDVEKATKLTPAKPYPKLGAIPGIKLEAAAGIRLRRPMALAPCGSVSEPTILVPHSPVTIFAGFHVKF